MPSMVVYLFSEWEKLSTALATTENRVVDMFDYPIGAPGEELYSEGARTYGDYLEIWGTIRAKSQSAEEIALLDQVVFFGGKWSDRYGTDWEPRLELPLIPTHFFEGDSDVYVDNSWNFLSCALKPQSVREVCETALQFEVEDYKERFYAVNDRGSLFEDYEPGNPSEDFENFKRYYASWHACLVDAAQENCGLLVFCW